MPTNKELESMLVKMEKRNDELSARLLTMEEAQRPEEAYGDLPTSFRNCPDGGGWVVRTPNRQFNGNTCSIRFVQGMAVIAKDTEDAENKVRTLVNEYGYSAQPVGKNDLDSFNQYIINNLAELMEGKSPDMEAKFAGLQPVFGGTVRGG